MTQGDIFAAKKCTKCARSMHLSLFPKDRSCPQGHKAQCRECCKKWRDEHRDRLRTYDRDSYYRRHERELARSRIVYSKNRDRYLEQGRIYRTSILGRAKSIFCSARLRAQKKNWVFDIDESHLVSLIEAGCAKTGIRFELEKNGKRKPFGPSLDRIDSSQPYTTNNIQMVCNTYNMGKSDHDEIDFIAMCCAVAERHASDPAVIQRLKELRNAEF